MIIRNSLKSVIRSPLKSILFFLLIMALVAALSLGSALVSMCSALIRRCDSTYTTVASVEYRGGRFPEKSVSDKNAARIRAGVDFDALSELKYVKAVDKSDTAIVSLPDFNRILAENSSSQNVVVVVAKKLSNDNAMAKVTSVLYSDALAEDRLINIYVNEPDGKRVPFNGEEGHYYLFTGYTNGDISGVIDVYMSFQVNEKAKSAGIVQESAYIDVTDDKKLENGDPRYDFFFDAANAYALINHSWYARISPDPSFLETFVEKDYTLREGRMYTEKDAANGTKCLLPDVIADRWNVKPGDEVTLILMQTGFSSLTDSYWPETRKETEAAENAEDGPEYGIANLKCTVTGIIVTTAREIPLIYLSDLGGIQPGDGFCGYTLGTLYLKNGITGAQLEEIRSLLPEGAEIAVYDQGYSVVTESLAKLRGDASGVVAAAAIASLAMLVLFAFVFVGRQSDSVVTMYLMGTPVRGLVLYVVCAAAAVLIPASVAGNIFASVFSGSLTGLIDKSLAGTQSVMSLYSSASLGISIPFTGKITMPAWPGILCAVLLCIAGIAACLVFLHIALRPVSPEAYTVRKEKKEKSRSSEPKNAMPLKLSGAARKYILLSIKRGGIRTLAIPLVSALMVVFILVPANALSSYKKQIEELNNNTRIDCYFTDYGGKRRYDLVLMDNMVGVLNESEYFDNFHFSACDPYAVVYTLSKGEEGEQVRTEYGESVPSGGFSFDSFLANFMNGPKMFYTDEFTSVPEFVGKQAPEVRWLDGYGYEYFTEERNPFPYTTRDDRLGTNIFKCPVDARELNVVVPESFLEQYKVKLGDSVGMLVSEDLVKEEYKIVGAFHDVGTTNFIYTRRDNVHKTFIIYSQVRPGMPTGEMLVVKPRNSSSSGSFRLTDTNRIVEAKEWLKFKGFSRVHESGFYRLYPILEDQEYCESLEKLQRNIGYLEKVLPAMAALVLLAGFAAAYLLMFRRRVEIATLRSIGETSARVFFIFCAEQLSEAVLGTLLCVAIWIAVAGINANMWLSAAFFAGFFIGTVISALRMSRNNLLDVLSDRE